MLMLEFIGMSRSVKKGAFFKPYLKTVIWKQPSMIKITLLL